MTKGGGGNALYRALGSIAFMAEVRAALLVTPDPNDDDRRDLSVSKMNLAKMPPSCSSDWLTIPRSTLRVSPGRESQT